MQPEPHLLYAPRNSMPTELPLSTKVQWTFMFPMVVVMTKGSLYGWCTHRLSASMKVMSYVALLKFLGGFYSR